MQSAAAINNIPLTSEVFFHSFQQYHSL